MFAIDFQPTFLSFFHSTIFNSLSRWGFTNPTNVPCCGCHEFFTSFTVNANRRTEILCERGKLLSKRIGNELVGKWFQCSWKIHLLISFRPAWKTHFPVHHVLLCDSRSDLELENFVNNRHFFHSSQWKVFQLVMIGVRRTWTWTFIFFCGNTSTLLRLEPFFAISSLRKLQVFSE